MTTYYGVLYRGGSHRCFTSTDGIQKVEVGCSHRQPRSAIDHANALASRAGLDCEAPAQPEAPDEPEPGVGGGRRPAPVGLPRADPARSLSGASPAPARVPPPGRGARLVWLLGGGGDMEPKTVTVHPVEVRKAIRDVRHFLRLCEAAMNRADLAGAYQYAERAQHAAFDAKALLQSGGKYE